MGISTKLKTNSNKVVTKQRNDFASWSEELMRSRGILQPNETIEQVVTETVEAISSLDSDMHGEIDKVFKSRLDQWIRKGVFVFGTPLLTNLRQEGATTAACTVLNLRESKDGIDFSQLKKSSTSALGAAIGTGYDLSEVENPVEALYSLNEMLREINANLVANNKRPSASMATLRADHPMVAKFVDAKRDADFSEWRLNISLFVTEELFRAAEASESWNLTDNDGKTVATIDAKELVSKISDSAWYCGEPGILFADRIDRDNPTPQWEYVSTAPCAEVAMAEGEACQFSYINVGATTCEAEDGTLIFDKKIFSRAVGDMTRTLDAAVEKTIRHQALLDLHLVGEKRRIGVGITGFADLLVKLRIPYGSDESVKLAAEISELLDYNSKSESVSLSMRRGAFPAFQDSRFQDEQWVQRKDSRRTGVVSDSDWETLHGSYKASGIRHSSTTAMPPTGTSSTIVDVSQSLEPMYSLISPQGGIRTVVVEALLAEFDESEIDLVLAHIEENDGLIKDSRFIERVPYLATTARQLDYAAHLDVQAGFQSFLDESLSKTINMANDAGQDSVHDALMFAYRNNLKGMTVFRDGCLVERATAT